MSMVLSAGNIQIMRMLRDAIIKAGVTDPGEQAMFIAQVAHESVNFTRLEENLRYKPDRLMAISQTARKKGIEAVTAACQQGPAAVAEIMYSGRMGNDKPGDGYKYRGRGYLQLTGKNNYTNCAKATGLDIVNNPDLLLKPDGAVKSAVWFWMNNVHNRKISMTDCLAVTLAVNGGTIGLEERRANFNRLLPIMRSGNFSNVA